MFQKIKKLAKRKAEILTVVAIFYIVTIAVLDFDHTTFGRIFKNADEQHLATSSSYIKEFSLEKNSWPNGITVDKDGMVWMAGSKTHEIYRFDPSNNQIKSYPIENSNVKFTSERPLMVWSMLQDKDGFIWFSQLGGRIMWRFEPSTANFYPLDGISSSPFQMKLDKYNNIWFTTLGGDSIGVIQRIQNVSKPYQVTEFHLANRTQPTGLFVDDGNLWVTEILNQKIVKFKVLSENGHISNIEKESEIPSFNKTSLYLPTDIFVSKHTVWTTEHETNFITRYQMDKQEIHRYPTSQSPYGVATLPFWIRPVDNGTKIWFNEHEGNKIALLDVATNDLTEYNIPSRPSDGFVTYALNISIDPNDNNKLWFTELNTDKFGVVDAGISPPFVIGSNTSSVVLSNDSSVKSIINIKISKDKMQSDTQRLYLNASSSLDQAGGLFKIDSQFSKKYVDLNDNNEYAQLYLRNLGAPSGNFTLGISASDGTVTRTIFLDLIVPKYQSS